MAANNVSLATNVHGPLEDSPVKPEHDIVCRLDVVNVGQHGNERDAATVAKFFFQRTVHHRVRQSTTILQCTNDDSSLQFFNVHGSHPAATSPQHAVAAAMQRKHGVWWFRLGPIPGLEYVIRHVKKGPGISRLLIPPWRDHKVPRPGALYLEWLSSKDAATSNTVAFLPHRGQILGSHRHYGPELDTPICDFHVFFCCVILASVAVLHVLVFWEPYDGRAAYAALTSAQDRLEVRSHALYTRRSQPHGNGISVDTV